MKQPHVRPRPRGIVLVLVMVVIAMLALAAMSFSDLMLNERRAAQLAGRQAQARAFAQSGAELARQFLDRTPEEQEDAGGLYDNPQRFQNVVVDEDDSPEDRGVFSLVAPRIENNVIVGVRYGLQDESARLNLAALLDMEKKSKGSAKKMLTALPSMTDEIADAILDWIDADDTPRENGAEADYYASLAPPYAPRNGSPETIEELLLVRGVTPQLLFGFDAFRMGLLTAPPDGEYLEGVDNADRSMDHGWAAYLTLHSAESTLKPDGTKKIDLNQDDLQQLYADLTEALDEPSALFIVAYRGYGAASSGRSSGGTSGESSQTLTAELLDIPNLKSKTTLTSVLDLFDVAVEVPAPKDEEQKGDGGKTGGDGRGGGGGPGGSQHPKTIRIASPFTESSAATCLPRLMAVATIGTEETIRGRININQAPRAVLLCVPGMTEDIADQIIANRTEDPLLDSEDHRYETWPLSEGFVSLKTMKALQPFVTAGGCVYRAQILGTFAGGGPVARLEVLLDTGKPPTRLLFWKDRSRLPNSFPVESALQENSAEK